MKVIKEMSFEEFTPWSGAKYNYNLIKEQGKGEKFEEMINELFPDGAEEIEINDVLWFEDELLDEYLELGLIEDESDIPFM